MTEPDVLTAEASNDIISEYVDTISEDESEYAAPGLRQKTIEDTEISTVNDNKCVPADVNNDINWPDYKYTDRELQNVPFMFQLLGGIFILFNFVSFMVHMFLMAGIDQFVKDTYGEFDVAPIYYIFLMILGGSIAIETFFFMAVSVPTVLECCTKPVHDGFKRENCILPKSNNSIRKYIKVMGGIGMFLISCYLVSDIYPLLKIVLIGYTVLYRGYTIGLVFYSKKYCRCPACIEFHRPEDVRITYGDKVMNIRATKYISSSELQEYFGISLIEGTHLGIQIAGGEIVRELQSSGYRDYPLNKGDYVVKIMTIIKPGKPEYSCADCGTCTPWNKIEQQVREARVTKSIIIG